MHRNNQNSIVATVIEENNKELGCFRSTETKHSKSGVATCRTMKIRLLPQCLNNQNLVVTTVPNKSWSGYCYTVPKLINHRLMLIIETEHIFYQNRSGNRFLALTAVTVINDTCCDIRDNNEDLVVIAPEEMIIR